LKDGKVVGVAFQGVDESQNIGYIVPTPVVRHFLSDLERNGKYTGFVTMGITFSPLENGALRASLGVDEIPPEALPRGVAPTGILVLETDPLRASPDETVGLRKDDVVLAIDGLDVGDDGKVFFRGMERVHLAHAVSHKFDGESSEATVWRNGSVKHITVPLKKPSFLVPDNQWDHTPKYYIYGGLVFCPLSVDYLKDEFGKKYWERTPPALLAKMLTIFMKHRDQQVVILSQILASDLSIGYDLRNCCLHKVNGEVVRNLRHVVELVENSSSKFIVFELDHEMKIVLDRSQVEEHTQALMEQHSIPARMSADL